MQKQFAVTYNPTTDTMIGVIATQVICFSRAKLPCRSSQKRLW